jgi:hypothetical protein
MARWNLKITSFVVGATTFNAKASGVYVLGGRASGADVLNRIERLPYGGIHDLDGTNDAPKTPPEIWNDFLFVGTAPYAHAEYSDLIDLEGKHGTLIFEIPTSGAPAASSALARLLKTEGEWQPPYMTAKTNWLIIRATWQLKAFPA